MAEIGGPSELPLSQQSTDSGTNPNTPIPARSESPELNTKKNDTAVAEPSPDYTSSPSEPIRTYDISPTWPRAIDVTNSTAIAVWQTHRLPGLFIDLHWHPPSNKAFFRLRAPVLVKGLPGARRDGKTSIYLFIHPERIRQLATDLDPIEKLLGVETVALIFDLDSPPALILPKTQCEPKNDVAKELMETFRRLASQTSFTIHINVPRRKLLVAQIQELCAAASGQRMTSLAAHANAASLYQGQGGQVVEGDGSGLTLPANDDAPPEYSEPSVAPYTGKKRQRRSSSSSVSKSPESANHKAMQALLESGLSSLKQHFDEVLATHKKDVVELLDRTETRILDVVRKEMDQRCDGIQEVVEDRIRQEMAEVEETVMRNISEAPLQASLTFPRHPWY